MITPVLLCGGSGTRLWPLSRKSYPKQFAVLSGETTLFQQSASRLSGEGYANPVVVTASDFRFIVTEQLAEMGIDPAAILIEPDARNTAPAVLAAALHVAAQDPEGLVLVAPSDHVVGDAADFRQIVSQGAAAANAGQIVTFGVTPDRPETGYGYLELSAPAQHGETVPLKQFVEKPDLPRAQEMLAAGDFLWNAGIFLFKAQVMIEAFRAHAPSILPPVEAAYQKAQVDLGFLRLAPEAWSQAEDISVDFAVMEKANNLSVVKFSGSWSDLGGWDAVWRDGQRNDAGTVMSGAATSIDCKNSLLRSENDAVEVVGLGLEDTIVVATPDAVLVADKGRAQDVKRVVSALKNKGARQATTFPKDHRPWGWFESLALGNEFQVKRIHVHPGAALSLQAHRHRAEHWIVVEGKAKVTIDDDVRTIGKNQSVYVPLGAVHRMENPGTVPLVLIEVQTGDYLGEDDIIRFEDIYGREAGVQTNKPKDAKTGLK